MRAIFLDRDGVICENRADYVKSWAEFKFLPGAKNSLATLSRLGLPIIVVTNQSGIGRGVVSTQTIEDIHRNMVAQVTAHGGRIDRVVYCPHHPGDGCNCRKPESGMLVQVAEEMGLDLVGSYMIGDAASDLIAGQRVGCRAFLVLTGRGFQQLLPALRSVNGQFTVTRNLVGATSQLLKLELNATGKAVPPSATALGYAGE
ncbi:MAG: D-glycero-beta-D-manno-heptose 1,7-bisphosphate 7-phosphatase [Anaerolineae bacterium]